VSAPAIVQGDRIQGICPGHMVGQSSAGPLPFSAPLTVNLVPTVLIGGKPAAVMGSSGFNTPPHTAPLTDPFAAPMLQKGEVLNGSVTVQFGGKPAATAQSSCRCCATPGQLLPTVPTVLIG
jgi:uncharacterized Zn-binding protein involved in type VI secretion